MAIANWRDQWAFRALCGILKGVISQVHILGHILKCNAGKKRKGWPFHTFLMFTDKRERQTVNNGSFFSLSLSLHNICLAIRLKGQPAILLRKYNGWHFNFFFFFMRSFKKTQAGRRTGVRTWHVGWRRQGKINNSGGLMFRSDGDTGGSPPRLGFAPQTAGWK